MDDWTVALLKELTQAPGVPGYETEIRRIVREKMRDLAEIESDNLGSVICVKRGSSDAPRVMIPGHMDEIGFMVKLVTKEGFLRFWPLGGWWTQVILGQRVTVHGSKGPVTGVVGSKPPHIIPKEERKKVVELKDMFIDVGAASGDEVKELGVKVGDPVVPVCPFERLPKGKLLAKAWDDRVGVALFMDVIRALAEGDHPNTVCGVGTVQEEVGTRGARTSAYAVDPDVCLVAEVGIAADTPGIKPEEAQGELGKGPQICVLDGGMIPHLGLRDLVFEVAEKEGIPCQVTGLTGGATDGRPIHLHARGVPSVYIGVPARYIHTHAGIISAEDYDNTLRLLVEVVKRLDGATVEGLKGG